MEYASCSCVMAQPPVMLVSPTPSSSAHASMGISRDQGITKFSHQGHSAEFTCRLAAVPLCRLLASLPRPVAGLVLLLAGNSDLASRNPYMSRKLHMTQNDTIDCPLVRDHLFDCVLLTSSIHRASGVHEHTSRTSHEHGHAALCHHIHVDVRWNTCGWCRWCPHPRAPARGTAETCSSMRSLASGSPFCCQSQASAMGSKSHDCRICS